VFNLKDFLPKKPGEVELKVMKEMFEASVDGEAFDMDKWGQYFKPSGYNAPAGNTPKATKPAVDADAEVEEDTVVEMKSTPAPKAEKADDSGSASGRAQDILAMIRNRNKQ
jgi:hypothetical protein